MCLEVVHLLDTVFECSEEEVVVRQLPEIVVTDKTFLYKVMKSLESTSLAQAGLLASVHQLKNLYEEFYLPYPPVPSLDIPAEGTAL